jgi:transmembrane sensor
VITESDLLRFIEGDCTPDEARTIQAWIAADPAREKLLDELRAVWQLTGTTSRRWSVLAAWERLRRLREQRPLPPSVGMPSRLAARLERAARVGHQRHGRRSLGAHAWRMRVGAAVVLAVAGAWYGFMRSRGGPPRDYVTAPGQRADITLRDGSRVILSVDTWLRVPGDYGVRDRSVELEGEAYFVVRHDARRPMVVRTRYGVAEDLGTEFGVRAYRHDHDVQVTVRDGAVAMRRSQDAGPALLTLGPGDRGILSARGEVTAITDVPVDKYLSWTTGRLVFDDTPLRSVIPELARWYDLDIQLDDESLGDERITIVLTTESPDEAMSAVAKVLDLRVVRTERSVRFVSLRPRR